MLPIRFLPVAGLALLIAACSSEPQPPAGIKAYYNCGETQLQATYYDSVLDVQLDGKVLRFEQTIAASGARFFHSAIEEGVEGDIFWSKGADATLMMGDDRIFVCTQVEPSTMASKGQYKALGQEPGWMVLVDGNRMDVQTNYGEEQKTIEGVKTTPSGKGTRFQAGDTTLTVTYGICQDSMSGIYFSDSVKLETGGQTYNGCGGYLVEQVAETYE